MAETKSTWRDYLELTKPRLSMLSVITAVVGFFAARVPWDGGLFLFMLIGTSLCAAGVASLNQWMETDTDAQMKRTADRPLPAGRVASGSAFVIGWVACFLGLALLFAQVGKLAALFALATVVSYLAVYTPAKRWSRWSTEIGAVAGAFPPLIGWGAAGAQSAALGWVLFGILFFWQIPHFMAIAWLYRKDYATVHFPMLAVRDESGNFVARWSLVATLALVAVCGCTYWLGLSSVFYLGATAVLGAWFLGRAVAFLRATAREVPARKLFLASVTWLPLQLLAFVLDRWFLAP